MTRYVDGFVVPVPKKKLAVYHRMAQTARKVWRDHGALEYVEAVADDVKWGKRTSSAQRQTKAQRDRGVFLHRVQVQGGPRSCDRQGDEGQAPGRNDGPKGDALRRQAHDLRRLQGHCGALSSMPYRRKMNGCGKRGLEL